MTVAAVSHGIVVIAVMVQTVGSAVVQVRVMGIDGRHDGRMMVWMKVGSAVSRSTCPLIPPHEGRGKAHEQPQVTRHQVVRVMGQTGGWTGRQVGRRRVRRRPLTRGRGGGRDV